MSTEPEKMSINVYTTHKDSILKSDNSSNEYILKMNEELNKSNSELRLKVQELRNMIDDLESETDKQDSSIRYMRGMIKNYIELNNLHKSIMVKKNSLSKIDSNELNTFDSYCNDVRDAAMCATLLYMFNNIVFLYFDMVSILGVIQNIFSIFICVFSSCHLYQIGKYYNIFGKDYKVVNNIIKNIDDDIVKIKEIESSSDFLSEYVDNL